MDKKQFERLPKYAQVEIARLEKEVEHWKQQYEQTIGKAESNTFIWQGMEEVGIGSPTVRYYLPHGCVDVSIVDQKLNIRGGDRIAILPDASNSATVVVRDRKER